MPARQIFARRQLRRGVDPASGEPWFFALGEQIPEEQFGSEQSLRAAESRGLISVVPISEGRSGVASTDLHQRMDDLEAENTALKQRLAELEQPKPAKRAP